jgi:MFS family permease
MKVKEENQDKIGYREITTQKEFCKLIVANLINRFGDSVDALAFTWLVYQVTKSASWSAIIYALNVLPTIVLQPFAGVVVERKSKKQLMIIMDILRGIFVIVLATSYMTQIINPWLMAAFTLCISSAEAFCLPASTAIIPKLLDEKYYEFGTSLNLAACKVMELAGMAVAGIIIGVFGIGVAILIDATTFFISAVIKTSIKLSETMQMKKYGKGAITGYIQDLKGGISYIRTKQIVMNFCIMAFLLNAMLVPLNSLQSPLVIDVLKQGSGLLSVIGISMTVGMGIATILYPYLSKLVSVHSFICINGGCLSLCIGIITLGGYQTNNTLLVYLITSVAAFLIGFFVDLVNCAVGVQFMKCVDGEYLARTAALLSAGAMSAIPLVSVILSFAVHFIQVDYIIKACSVICVIIFLFIWIKKVKFEEEEKHGTENFIKETD